MQTPGDQVAKLCHLHPTQQSVEQKVCMVTRLNRLEDIPY